jgi:hypothetical protein
MTEQSRPTRTEDGAASGRHRLRDNDTVPVRGFRTYREILSQTTMELPMVNRADPPMFTPGQEQRAGIRDWLG